jgi:hypothetical protein
MAVEELEKSARALATWHSSLSRGILPDPKTIEWPAEPMLTGWVRALDDLDMARFTRKHPALTDLLLKNLMGMSLQFDQEMREWEESQEEQRRLEEEEQEEEDTHAQDQPDGSDGSVSDGEGGEGADDAQAKQDEEGVDSDGSGDGEGGAGDDQGAEGDGSALNAGGGGGEGEDEKEGEGDEGGDSQQESESGGGTSSGGGSGGKESGGSNGEGGGGSGKESSSGDNGSDTGSSSPSSSKSGGGGGEGSDSNGGFQRDRGSLQDMKQAMERMASDSSGSNNSGGGDDGPMIELDQNMEGSGFVEEQQEQQQQQQQDQPAQQAGGSNTAPGPPAAPEPELSRDMKDQLAQQLVEDLTDKFVKQWSPEASKIKRASEGLDKLNSQGVMLNSPGTMLHWHARCVCPIGMHAVFVCTCFSHKRLLTTTHYDREQLLLLWVAFDCGCTHRGSLVQVSRLDSARVGAEAASAQTRAAEAREPTGAGWCERTQAAVTGTGGERGESVGGGALGAEPNGHDGPVQVGIVASRACAGRDSSQ